MFTTDTSRARFLIRVLVDKSVDETVDNSVDILEWIFDGKGVKVQEYVIIPMLKVIERKINTFNNGACMEILKYYNNPKKATELHDFQKASSEVRTYITQDTTKDEILKYIVPYFQLERKTITHKKHKINKTIDGDEGGDDKDDGEDVGDGRESLLGM